MVKIESKKRKKMNIYFSDFFNVAPSILEEYGALNISLVNDLPLFIDPFLLFTSEKEVYHQLHSKIIKYLQFLRDQSISGNINNGLLRAWYMFPEVKQVWLGYSLDGNRGRGLGPDFARALNANLHTIFKNFGQEKVTKGSHLEKVCLIESGVGRDNISDLVANLIKEYLLDYTQGFARKNIVKELRQTISVPKACFNYEVGKWQSKCYDLPYYNEDYVLLSPRDILTRDENWINRSDLIKNVERIAIAVPDEQLRAEVNQYLSSQLKSDLKKKLTKNEKEKIFSKVLKKYPQLIEYYIRSKEDSGHEAKRQSNRKVLDAESIFIKNAVGFYSLLNSETEFYKHGIDTLAEARVRVDFLKKTIENNDGYRLLYHNGKPIAKESDLQILFKFVWLASPSDFNSEVNNGRGPVDFKVSRGSKDKSLVEFKLTKNSRLKQNLKNQVEIYEKANQTKKSLKVIFYFSEAERIKVMTILKELKCEKDKNIILVDARNDNKPSASAA